MKHAYHTTNPLHAIPRNYKFLLKVYLIESDLIRLRGIVESRKLIFYHVFSQSCFRQNYFKWLQGYKILP